MAILDDLSAFWTLDEASGTREDSHTNNLDLTDNNTVAQVAGKIGNAADFTAANSESLSNSGNDSHFQTTDDFTYCYWVKLKNLSAIHDLVGKWGTGANREYVSLFLNSSTRFQHYIGRGPSTFTAATANSFGAPSADVWYFVANFFDKSASTYGDVGISVNGGTIDWASLASAAQTSGTDDFTVGALPTIGRYSDSSIDQVGFWKRLLDSDDIDLLYNDGDGRAYPFSAALCDLALKGMGS